MRDEGSKKLLPDERPSVEAEARREMERWRARRVKP